MNDRWAVRHPGIGVVYYGSEAEARVAAGTAGEVIAPVAAREVKRDPLGCVYDRTWTSSYGTTYYQRDRALGRAEGYAQWSDEHDCNPVCGCHLEAKCMGCGVCLTCDGCYCREGDDW